MSSDESTWDTAEKIAALRAACGSDLKPYCSDAPTLARFLRSRKGDVELAKKSLLRHQEWRAEATPEFPLKNTMPSAKTLATGTSYVRGVDKLGRPAIVVRVRKHDGNMDRAEMQRQVIFYLDEAIGRAVRRSKPADGTATAAADPTGATAMQREQFVVILDATDTAWANVDTGATNFIFLMLAANAPERLGKLYILNAGFFFSMCWKVRARVRAWVGVRACARGRAREGVLQPQSSLLPVSLSLSSPACACRWWKRSSTSARHARSRSFPPPTTASSWRTSTPASCPRSTVRHCRCPRSWWRWRRWIALRAGLSPRPTRRAPPAACARVAVLCCAAGGSDDYVYTADCVTGGDRGVEASEYVTVREGCLPAWHAAFAKPDTSSTPAADGAAAAATGGSGAA